MTTEHNVFQRKGPEPYRYAIDDRSAERDWADEMNEIIANTNNTIWLAFSAVSQSPRPPFLGILWTLSAKSATTLLALPAVSVALAHGVVATSMGFLAASALAESILAVSVVAFLGKVPEGLKVMRPLHRLRQHATAA
jgi:hypothetical protein